MASHIALLRGINVGGRNKVGMAELREVVTSLGHTGVRTYIQSGNVLFSAPDGDNAKLATALQAAIAAAFGLEVSVVVLTRDELAWILDRNPHPDEPDPKRVHVVFLNTDLPAALLERIKAAEDADAAQGGGTVTVVGPACICIPQAASATASWPWPCSASSANRARPASRRRPGTGPRPPSCCRCARRSEPPQPGKPGQLPRL